VWQLFGVSWHKRDCKWSARVSVPGGKKYHECFADEIEAGKRYDFLVSALSNIARVFFTRFFSTNDFMFLR